MIKIVGALLIVGGAGGFGIAKAMQLYRRLRQLHDLLGAVEIIKCELNYTMRPLAQLAERTAERSRGAIAAFLKQYAANLDKGLPRARSAADALDGTKGLCLPNDAQMAILELLSTVGRYDLDGENRLLQLTGQRLRAAIERFESEKRPVAKSYAILGVTTGIALVILFL